MAKILKPDGTIETVTEADLERGGPDPVRAVTEVSRAQAKIALHRTGYLTAVEFMVEAEGGEVAIWFADALNWRRDNPHVVTLGGALGLSPAEIDQLFTMASEIDA